MVWAADVCSRAAFAQSGPVSSIWASFSQGKTGDSWFTGTFVARV